MPASRTQVMFVPSAGNPNASIRTQLVAALAQAWRTVQTGDAALSEVQASAPASLAVPKQLQHGDYTTPMALALGRACRQNPRVLAQRLADALGDADGLLQRCEVAGPGHLNLFVRPQAWRDALWRILCQPGEVLRSQAGLGQKVLVEFVSANPTGPLHVAHGRGAVFGDVVCRLLAESGHDVTREYYVNDMGNQTDVLAQSVYAHYRALCGAPFVAPAEYYPGDYVQDLAKQLFAAHGAAFCEAGRDAWLPVFRDGGVTAMLARIRADLAAFNVPFDSWVSEKALAQPEVLAGVVATLRERGHVYDDAEGRVWFRSTDFGDDKDRVMVREDGRPTYFLSDVAYHRQKAERGFSRLLNVWGADHGGYLPRIHASLAALGFDPKLLQVNFIQMVSLSRGGEAVKMGKRLGTAVWLREVIDEAGRDATRYLFLTRRLDTQMDFDIDLASKKSLDNPVFYAQMGHARLCAIARKAQEQNRALPAIKTLSAEALHPLQLDDELLLLRGMARAADVVADAAAALEPHQITAYVQTLIADFHSYYSRNKQGARVLGDDAAVTQARLLLCLGLQHTLRALLGLLGVDAPEQMTLAVEGTAAPGGTDAAAGTDAPANTDAADAPAATNALATDPVRA